MLRKPARESIFAAGMVRMVCQGKENGSSWGTSPAAAVFFSLARHAHYAGRKK